MAYEFLLIGLTIIIGFITTVLFERTRISQVIPLMLFGFLLGPAFGVLDVSPTSFIITILPFIATLALIVLLFDGGMEFDIFTLARAIPKSTIFTLMVFASSVIFVAFFAKMLPGEWSFIEGALLGAVIGGVSSAVVIAMVERTGVKKETKSMLTVESTLTDALCIVSALILLEVIRGGTYEAGAIMNILLSQITIAIALGLVSAVVWLIIVEKFVFHKYAYMLMLALVFILFAATESVKASGGIAVFVFGMVLGNARKLGKITQTHWENPISRMMRLFQEEVTFFIRTFFFVYIGLLLSLEYFKPTSVIIALGLTAILLIARIIVGKFVLKGMPERDSNVAVMMMPRGLAAAVLATIPITAGLQLQNFQEIVFGVILFSNLAATLGVCFFDRGEKEEEEEEKEKETTVELRKEDEKKKNDKKGKKKGCALPL